VRIAQVVPFYHPQIGGVETHVRSLAQGCAAAGDEVTVLTHQNGGNSTDETIESVRVLRFPLSVRSTTYPFSIRLFSYLRQHATEFDLVHSHSYHTLVGHAAIHSRLPFVFTPHYHGTGHTPFRVLLHRLYRPSGSRQFGAADAIICVSEAERTLVVKDFPDAAGKITTIPNGTSFKKLTPSQDGGRCDEPMILIVGRLERYKNLDLVIAAFQTLPSAATLVVVGEGPDRSRLERLVRSGQPAWPVRFTGRASAQQLDGLLARATVVASASDHEAFGLTLAEGLASGARVVASGIPAHREIGRLAGHDAPITFADPRDTPQFAKALAESLASGRVTAGELKLPSWGQVVAATRDLYARTQARGHPGRGGRLSDRRIQVS
jgi:glycosyltransferase involved in cell wall biosynthesis